MNYLNSISYKHTYKVYIIFIIALIGFVFLNLSAPCHAQQQGSQLQRDFNTVAQTVKPCVVGIISYSDSGVPIGTPGSNGNSFSRPFTQTVPAQQKIGSGTFIDNRGYILTNYHVIEQSKDIHVILGDSRSIRTKTHEATVILTDPVKDLAVLQIVPDEPVRAAALGNSETIKIGDWVMAIGSTFGFEQTITAGIVGAKGRTLNLAGRIYTGLIQTDAAINQGNSGGPLINMNGEIIGVNTAIYSPDGAFSGMGFAIPINQTVDLINQALGTARNSPQAAVQGPVVPVAFFSRAPVAQIQTPPSVTKTKNEYLQCPNCQIQINQSIGIPWSNAKCPSCGAIMAHVIEKNETVTQNTAGQGTAQNPATQMAYHYPNLGNTWPVETAPAPIQQVPCIGAFCPAQPGASSPLNQNVLPPPDTLDPSRQVAGGGSFCPSQTVAFVPFNQNDPSASNNLLVAGSQPAAPYLGVSLSPTPDGLQVTEVSVNSPAEIYGIKTGDIMSSINQNIVRDIADFDDAMGKIRPGSVMRVTIMRGESKRPLYIKTGTAK